MNSMSKVLKSMAPKAGASGGIITSGQSDKLPISDWDPVTKSWRS
jgi:hypothetical protein